MKLNVRYLLTALVALILGAVPALALAQGPFPSSGNAAGSQYGGGGTTGTTGTTATTTTTGVTVTGTVTGGVTTPVSGQGTPPAGNGGGNSGGGNSGGSSGGGNSGGGNGGGNSGGGNGGGNSGGGNNGGGGQGGGPNAAAAQGAQVDPRLTAPYATITLSPPNQTAIERSRAVTGVTAYDANLVEPMDVNVLKQVTDGTRWAGAATDNKKLAAFARALGKSVVNGGLLAKAAFPKLATGVDAKYIHPMAGFVLVHTYVPLKGDDKTRRDAFVRSFIKGMKTVKIPTVKSGTTIGVPIVGIELVKQKTTVPFFRSLGVTTVDNIDRASGLKSLAATLDGAKGHFGVKKVSRSGKVAKQPAGPKPLLYRPTASYSPGDLLRENDGGLAGGGASAAVLLLLSLVSVGALLAVVERRTRNARRKRSAV